MNDMERLKILGASLYLCEGTKSRRAKGRKNIYYAIEFTNKDPRAIKMFLRFMRLVLGADESRIKAQLFIYPDHSQMDLINYWSEVSEISKERFNDCIRLKQKNLRYKPNPLGTFKVRYTHKTHFLKLEGIINEVFGEVA